MVQKFDGKLQLIPNRCPIFSVFSSSKIEININLLKKQILNDSVVPWIELQQIYWTICPVALNERMDSESYWSSFFSPSYFYTNPLHSNVRLQVVHTNLYSLSCKESLPNNQQLLEFVIIFLILIRGYRGNLVFPPGFSKTLLLVGVLFKHQLLSLDKIE